MFNWNTESVYLFLHESIHKVNYNHNSVIVVSNVVTITTWAKVVSSGEAY